MVRFARADTADRSVDLVDEDTVQEPTPDHFPHVVFRMKTPIISPQSPPIAFRHLRRDPGQRRRQKKTK